MIPILYPHERRSAKDALWVCDACGAAEWSARRPAHECPARRDAWGKRTLAALRPARPAEVAEAERHLARSA